MNDKAPDDSAEETNSAEESPNFVEFIDDDLSGQTPQKVLDAIVNKALAMKASDIFLLAEEFGVSIKLRALGSIHRIALLSAEQGRSLVNSVKAAAGMDIAEKRRAGDGRMLYAEGDTRVDLRINTIPTLFGEDMTCRVLDRGAQLLGLDEIGMTRGELGQMHAMLSSSSGLILVTGPTGTGKTTTLYAALQYLNNGSRKLNTLEDPVEYAMPGVCQSQVNPKAGVHFSDLLPSVLRQSPDVIMVGEIRDVETAITAVRAANSGHLVMATLHAPVASGAVQSMVSWGSQPYFLASCLLGVIAQRLIRSLCTKCRVQYDISMAPDTFAEVQHLLEPHEGQSIFGPSGCEACFERGYSHRVGLFEVMTFNGAIRRAIAEGASTKQLEEEAIKNGMIEFRRGALVRVAQGVTSTEEMMQEVPSEHLGLDD